MIIRYLNSFTDDSTLDYDFCFAHCDDGHRRATVRKVKLTKPPMSDQNLF